MCCKEVFEGGGAAGKSIGTQLFVQALCPGDPPFPSLHGMYLFAAGQSRLARPASQSGQRRPPTLPVHGVVVGGRDMSLPPGSVT